MQNTSLDSITTLKNIELLTKFVSKARLTRMQKVLQQRTRYVCVVLEDVYQPHNASAVLRSCDAFGVQDVHVLQQKNVFTPNPEISLGSAKWLTLHKYIQNPVEHVYSQLKKKGYKIIATTLEKKSTPLHKIDINSGPMALVFGSELNGLTEKAISYADETMYIPMAGFVESFNISVSVAIVLSELISKIKTLTTWRLSEEESLHILLEWLRCDVHHSKEIEQKLQ